MAGHKFGLEIRRYKKPETLGMGKKYLALYSQYYSLQSIENKRFYNIGAGTFRHPYWTNIDLLSEWYAESQDGIDTPGNSFINYNLFSLQPLPLQDEIAEVVYTSHTIEHVNDAAVQNMFNEAYRILKKGGIFRITTPDTDLYYKALLRQDKDFWSWRNFLDTDEICTRENRYPFNQYSLTQAFIFSFATHISQIIKDDSIPKMSDDEFKELFTKKKYEDALNECTSRCKEDFQNKYPGYHMNWWNTEKAFRMLKKAGFKNMWKSGYGQSICPVLRNTHLFDKQNIEDSLYIEAQK